MAWSKAAAEARREIIEDTLRKTPGLSFRQVCASTRIPAGTARHHLTMLVRTGRIWYTQLGGRLAHFAGSRPSSPVARRDTVAASFDQIDGRIYLLVRDHGPVAQKEILDQFDDEPKATLQHRVKRLVRFGIISERPQGRYRMYEVAEGL